MSLIVHLGYTNIDDLPNHNTNPHVAIHGSISTMINFLVIKDFAKIQNNNIGWSMENTSTHEGFHTALIRLSNNYKFEELKNCFNECINGLNPQTFSVYQRSLTDIMGRTTLENAVALIRLSDYEALIFLKFSPLFIDVSGDMDITDEKRYMIMDVVDKVMEKYYPLSNDKDVSFDCGRVYMGLKCFNPQAITCFRRSNIECGDHHVTWHNIGCCLYYINNIPQAIQAFTKSLQLDNTYQASKGMNSSPINFLKP